MANIKMRMSGFGSGRKEHAEHEEQEHASQSAAGTTPIVEPPAEDAVVASSYAAPPPGDFTKIFSSVSAFLERHSKPQRSYLTAEAREWVRGLLSRLFDFREPSVKLLTTEQYTLATLKTKYYMGLKMLRAESVEMEARAKQVKLVRYSTYFELHIKTTTVYHGFTPAIAADLLAFKEAMGNTPTPGARKFYPAMLLMEENLAWIRSEFKTPPYLVSPKVDEILIIFYPEAEAEEEAAPSIV